MTISLPKRLVSTFLLLLVIQTGCNPLFSPSPAPAEPLPTPTIGDFFLAPVKTESPTLSATNAALQPSPTVAKQADIVVTVDAQKNVHPISPLIYGLSYAPADVLKALRTPFNSWGGNTSTRYNWQINAWNAGKDWFYTNGDYGTEGSSSEQFLTEAKAAGAAVRFALPALGWVAKNDDQSTCSFPLPDGTCGDAEGANCDNPTLIADPNQANVKVDSDAVQAWVNELIVEKGFDIRFIAVDNEPELWGYTHYDVHPTCTTYQEILDTYIEYTQAVMKVAPEAEFVGPATCCWYFYWNSAASEMDKEKHGNQDFLPWFLESMQTHDRSTGRRSLHALDIHYYPEGVFNDVTDEETAARRLRSTRSLWDRSYIDESWIGEPITLIPRMQEMVETYYPGTKLGISEWNWGAEGHINGALAIADVLGIYGREGLYYASYWRYPALNSPAFFAFKMYTNFDDRGGRFANQSVFAESSNHHMVSTYAAIDSKTKNLHVMLINKHPDETADLQVQLENYQPKGTAAIYQYDTTNLEGIQKKQLKDVNSDISLTLPAYSITLLVIPGKVP